MYRSMCRKNATSFPWGDSTWFYARFRFTCLVGSMIGSLPMYMKSHQAPVNRARAKSCPKRPHKSTSSDWNSQGLYLEAIIVATLKMKIMMTMAPYIAMNT